MKKQNLLSTLFMAAALLGCGGGASSGNSTTDNIAVVEKVSLQVSKFGEGDVLANDKQMTCSNQICEDSFEKDKTVTFSVRPADGWSFSHWTGCDSQVGSKCEILAAKSTQVHPYFAKNTTPILHSNVVSLSDVSLDALLSRVGDVFTFGNSAEQLKAVKIGDVLLSSRGEGFAVRVMNLSSLSGGNTIVDTVPASIDEIISEGVLVKNSSLVPVGVVSSKGMTAKLMESVQKDDGVESSVAISFDGPPSVSGTLKMKWKMDTGFRYTFLDGLTELKLSANPELTFDVDVGLIGIKNEGKWKDVPKIKITFAPIPIGPIVLVPEATLVYKIDAEGNLSISFKEIVTVKGSVGVQYVPGVGMNGIGDIGATSFLKPSGEVGFDGKVRFSVGPDVALRVLGQAGPKFRAAAFIEGKGNITKPITLDGPSTDPLICGAELKIGMGVSADAGGDLKIFAKKLAEWNITLFEKLIFPDVFSWPKEKSKSCEDKESPSAPVIKNLAAESSRIKIDWAAATDNVGIIYYKIFREGSLIGRSSSLSYTDSGLQPDKSYCYRLVAVDAAGNESTPASNVVTSSGSESCARTQNTDASPPTIVNGVTAVAVSTNKILLNWNRATDDRSVSNYVVVTENLRVLQVTSLSTEIDKLKPNTEYCFRVLAVDAAGNSSNSSMRVCASTFPEALSAYTMKLGCQNREYNIEKKVDLDINISQVFSVTDNAKDYTGTNLAYHLYGNINAATKTLDAEIRWTFEGNSSIRIDRFVASLAAGDSGEVLMNQVQRTGCDAKIRITLN